MGVKKQDEEEYRLMENIEIHASRCFCLGGSTIIRENDAALVDKNRKVLTKKLIVDELNALRDGESDVNPETNVPPSGDRAAAQA